MSLSPDATADIRAALASARHGRRGAAARAMAARYGISESTVYRYAGRGGTLRRRQALHPEYREWVEVVMALSHRAPAPVPLDLAIESAIASGAVPAAAAAMPIGTAHRIARELGLRPSARRTQRLHADYPMQALQFDASTSQYLMADEALPDGDWLLRLHRAPAPSSYKNKPLAEHRLRVVVYGIWDMCTGTRRAIYTVARGENAADAAAALVSMLIETGDPERPMHGVPSELWCDQGPLWKARASRELLERLRIALAVGMPYQKTRQGGIERSWRTQWARFERALFLDGGASFRLSDINERLHQYERKENRRPARVRVAGRLVSRAAAWVALTNGRQADQPLWAMPADAIATLHRQGHRKLDTNGIVRWDGEEWECKEWHDREVLVRQGLAGDDDTLTLEDGRTGERSVARRYQTRRYGDVRGARRTPLDRLLDAATAVPVRGADPYAAGTNVDGVVVPFRARRAVTADLPNPLDATRYPDLDAALAGFCQLYPWPLSMEDRAAVVATIEAGDCRREAVAELASRLLRVAADGQ